MFNMGIYELICFVVSAIFSFFALSVVVVVCKKKGYVDTPDWRKVHKIAVPRLGGVIFMPSMLIALTVTMGVMFSHNDYNFEPTLSTFMMIVGAVMIYIIGIIDDTVEMKAATKFFIQLAASLFFPLCNLMITNLHGFCGIYELPMYLSYPLTISVVILVVNAMNLIDGIDGLSSGLSILILIMLTRMFCRIGAQLFVLICVATIASVLVFFLFNMFGKTGGKKIFMGDAGSLTLGYLISYLVIKSQMESWNAYCYNENALSEALTLVMIPCVDVVRVAVQRLINGNGMFSPDKTHIHHILMDTGLSMHQTLYVILALFYVYVAINHCLTEFGIQITYIFFFDLLLYGFILWMAMKLKKEV